jgi:hypothetical protein
LKGIENKRFADRPFRNFHNKSIDILQEKSYNVTYLSFNLIIIRRFSMAKYPKNYQTACAALRSEGGVHSHTRRAVKAGASKKEVFQTIALLINTLGFSTAAAAFSWVNDVTGEKRK